MALFRRLTRKLSADNDSACGSLINMLSNDLTKHERCVLKSRHEVTTRVDMQMAERFVWPEVQRDRKEKSRGRRRKIDDDWQPNEQR